MKNSLKLHGIPDASRRFSDRERRTKIDLNEVKARQLSIFAKRAFDFSASSIAILLLMPMFLLLALILAMTQGRPIFIRHKRIGQSGQSFDCLKFRTMVKNADLVLKEHLEQNPQSRDEWKATRKLKQDPRITPVGKILRQSSVDELPQLINIIRGEMSIVGPRPIVREEIAYYGESFSRYTKVRPGLTGLWQVSGRNDVSYQTRVQMDVRYVEQFTLYSDMVIIMKTIPAVLRSSGCY